MPVIAAALTDTVKQGTGSPASSAWGVRLTLDGSNFITALPVSQSGTWTIQQGGSPWSVAFAAPQHVIVDSGLDFSGVATEATLDAVKTATERVASAVALVNEVQAEYVFPVGGQGVDLDGEVLRVVGAGKVAGGAWAINTGAFVDDAAGSGLRPVAGTEIPAASNYWAAHVTMPGVTASAPLHVQPGTSVMWDVSDRSGRSLGQVTLGAGTSTVGKFDQGAPGLQAWPVSISSLPGFASPPAVAQSGTWSVGIAGTLPAFASAPTVVLGAGSAAVGSVTVTSLPNVVVSSSALPSGAATSAAQTTGNSSLSSIDTKTPALGATTAANSSPVTTPVVTNYKAASSSVPVGGTTLRSGAGKLMSFQIINSGASTAVVQLHDATAAPSGGDPPIWQASLTANAVANVTNWLNPLANGLRITPASALGGYSAAGASATLTYTINVEN